MARLAPVAGPPRSSGAAAGRRRRGGLRRLLLSIALVSAAVYAAFWTLWTWDHLGDERRQAEASVHRAVERAVGAFADFLAERTALTEEAAGRARDAGAAAACAAGLPPWEADAAGRPIGRTDVVRPDGSPVCSTATAGGGAPDDRGAPWLAPGYRPGRRTASYHDRTSGRPVWAVAYPVGGAADRGVLAAVVELDPASAQLGQIFDDGSGTEFLVWDTVTGEVLSRPERSDWAPDHHAGRFVDSAVVPTTTWRLAAGVRRSTAYAAVWSEARAAALALAAAMAVVALSTALVNRRILRPLRAITAAARRAAGGGATALELDGPAELADLAAALDDLTAGRAEAERLLQATTEDLGHSLERLDAVLANSADMVVIVDAGGRLGFASPAVVAVCGSTARPGVAFTSLVHPDDTAKAAALLRPGAPAGTSAELRMGGDGAWRHVEMVARDLLDHEAVRGIVLNGRDVTERLADAAQRAALDEQLHQSQRLESLGALAGGIAHDFKNLLSVVVWTTDLASGNPASGPLQPDLDQIRSAAARGVELAQQLLTFSRRDDAVPEPLDVGARLLELGDLLRRTLGRQIDLDLRVDASLPAVCVNPSRFDQAIVNLAVNARDAMGDRGRLVVEASGQVAVEDPALPPGPCVVVSVSDTGPGMAPDVASRAMEPFFTTKGPGQGTGLGLSIVHGIVTAAGGDVRIRSAPGDGTTVRLVLPASTRPVPVPGNGGERSPALGAGERVLVVEDNDPVRQLVERMLRQGGYATVGVSRPTDALDLVAAPRQRVDVVLTDVLMPAMSGADLAGRLHRLRPGLPVIFMSAHPADVLADLVSDSGGDSAVVLEKPFSPRQLLDAVHTALRGARAAGH